MCPIATSVLESSWLGLCLVEFNTVVNSAASWGENKSYDPCRYTLLKVLRSNTTNSKEAPHSWGLYCLVGSWFIFVVSLKAPVLLNCIRLDWEVKMSLNRMDKCGTSVVGYYPTYTTASCQKSVIITKLKVINLLICLISVYIKQVWNKNVWFLQSSRKFVKLEWRTNTCIEKMSSYTVWLLEMNWHLPANQDAFNMVSKNR